MKKLFTLIIILICNIVLSSCGQSNQITIAVPENVTKVIVAPYNSESMTFQYTNAQKVDAIVSYISDFGTLTSTTVSDPTKCVGINYKITLCSIDGSVEEYYHLGNLFFKQGESGDWCDMEYDKANALETLLREYEPDVPAEKPLFRDE